MLRKLRRLSELSPVELLVFCQLFFFAIAARVSLRFMPLQRLVHVLSVSAGNSLLKRFPFFRASQDWARLVVVADLAAKGSRGDGPCLLRSLLLFWLLKARGETAELLIGISKETSVLQSHAWIETEGYVIGDSAEMAGRFATLLRF